jgi:hypothetical protein
VTVEEDMFDGPGFLSIADQEIAVIENPNDPALG